MLGSAPESYFPNFPSDFNSMQVKALKDTLVP